MRPEVQRSALQLLEAVEERVTGADLELGVMYDHAASEALQALAGAFDGGSPEPVAYVLSIALEVLSELPAPAARGAFVVEFRRRAASGQFEPADRQNVSRFGTR